jgi:hypothetical protein
MAAGLLVGVLGGAAGTAQAQGVISGAGNYMPTGVDRPVTTVSVGQFPAAGLAPPYNPDTVGVPTSVDITILRGRADASPIVAGQFPLAFMNQSMPSPISR